MPAWLTQLFTASSVAQSIVVYAMVIAVGIALGKIRIAGISLGVTWVLFMGLLASYLGIRINSEVEEFVKTFGLVIFVYAIGLQVGPGFFASLKKNALGNNALAAAIVLLGAGFTIILFFWSGYPMPLMTGIMSGAVTNTPGLAAAQAAVKELHISNADPSGMTLAYAVAYPFAVIGIILAILFLKKVLQINLERERELHRKLAFIQSGKPVSIHLKLENKQLIGQQLRKIAQVIQEPFIISRMYHKSQVITPAADLIMEEGDVLQIVAPRQLIEKIKLLVGTESEMNLRTVASSNLVSRQVVVTRKEVTHKRLGLIDEVQQEMLTLTRVKRAGIEMVAHGNIFLQLGDTTTVVGTEETINRFAKQAGNSLKRLEVPDLGPIFMGIVLGVILGSIPFHFPSMPVAVKIGLAGGPLIVALLLSRFGHMLYLNNYATNSANLMIRELGITLFLASIGLSSGQDLTSAFSNGEGYYWVLMGMGITFLPLVVMGIIASKFFRKTYFEICGLLAGACTDPPALSFALKMAGNDIPSGTYATVYPLAMILRILVAQLLILFFA